VGAVHAHEQLDAQGYLLLRNAVPADWIAPLRKSRWPVPRGADWRHALVDLDPHVQRVCRLPALLDAVGHRLRGPFFLSQVEGREPMPGNRPQPLHRDGGGSGSDEDGGQLMAAMVWLDPYDAGNGATQVLAGSHRGGAAAGDARVLTGAAGDILIFDPDVLHGATTNSTGARRRSLLLSYAVAALRDDHRRTARLRNVRMDTDELFGAPPGSRHA
jgi:Phytanoyl-CoA dioxygenase (PhyH)